MDPTGDQNSDYAPDCKYCLRRLNTNRVVPNIILPPDYAKILCHKPATDEFEIRKCPHCGKMVLGTVFLEHQLRCVYDLYEPDNYMCDTCRESGFMEFHTEEEQLEMAMELSEFQEQPSQTGAVSQVSDLPESQPCLPRPSPSSVVDEFQVTDLPENQFYLPSKPQCKRKRDASGRFIREGPVPRPTKKGNNKRPTEVEKLTSWLGVGRDINTLANEPSLTRRGTVFRKSSQD